MTKLNRYNLQPFLRYKPIWVIRLSLLLFVVPSFVVTILASICRFLVGWFVDFKDAGNYESIESVKGRERRAKELVDKYFEGGSNDG